jgi:hypothetical protein
LGQQRLPPNRDQPFGVEVLGMNRPQSHLTAWWLAVEPHPPQNRSANARTAADARFVFTYKTI